MRFRSTRGHAGPVSFTTAMEHGLAPDGGLYVPEHFPRVDPVVIALIIFTAMGWGGGTGQAPAGKNHVPTLL